MVRGAQALDGRADRVAEFVRVGEVPDHERRERRAGVEQREP